MLGGRGLVAAFHADVRDLGVGHLQGTQKRLMRVWMPLFKGAVKRLHLRVSNAAIPEESDKLNFRNVDGISFHRREVPG